MAEYSRMAKGSFVSGGTSAVVNLPFKPDYVELWNYTNIKQGAANKVTRAWWDASLLDGANNPTMMAGYSAWTSETNNVQSFDTISNTAGNPGINAFSGGLSLQYGPAVKHVTGGSATDFSIAQSGANGAGPATTITVAGAGIPDHGLQTGDVVVFEGLYQTATTGMAQIAGIPFVVTRLSATTFSIFWDTSGSTYAAFNSGTAGSQGLYRKVLFPQLYLPQDNVVALVTLGATTTVKTTMQHGLQVGQEVAFRVPNIWGTTQLNSLPNVTIPGSPIYGYVVSVSDFQTFVVNINSSAFTAFNTNFSGGAVLPTSLPGTTYAQVVPVGDVNSGGVQISAGSQLYPAPQYSQASYNSNSTINGPAIIGAFVNNTRQGFTIGSGVGGKVSSFSLLSASDIIYWHAYLHDFAQP